jgi:hypothetical protein
MGFIKNALHSLSWFRLSSRTRVLIGVGSLLGLISGMILIAIEITTGGALWKN